MDENKQNLAKLLKIFDTSKIVSSDDIRETLTGVLKLLTTWKQENQNLNTETKQTVNSLLERVLAEHSKMKEDVTHETSKMKKETTAEFFAKLNEVKSLLKEVEKKKPKDGKDADEEIIVDKVLAQIKLPEYKETVLDGRPEIVTKINSGAKDDTQIALKQIENGNKLLTQTVLDRAIGILDQRSQFLINKVSNLQSQVDNAQISVGAIGGTITGGTAGSVLFVNPTGIIAQDNANLFYDSSLGNLGIGTNTPYLKLNVLSSTTVASFDSTITGDGAVIDLYTPNITAGNYGSISFRSDNSIAVKRIFASIQTIFTDKTSGSESGDFAINTIGVGVGAATERVRVTSLGDVGIGTAVPEGKLHVWSGNAGTVTADINANIGVFESASSNGISILTPDISTSHIHFGSPSTNFGARLTWSYSSNLLTIGTHNTGAEFSITTGNDVAAVRVDSSGKVGIGTTAPEGNLHVFSATAGTLTANANGNLGVFEAGGSNGISVLVPDASTAQIFFGSPTSNRSAEITWRYSTGLNQIGTRKVGGTMSLMTGNAVEAIAIDASQNVGIGGTGTGRVTIQGNGSNFNLELTNVTDAITAFKMTGGSTTLFMTSRSTYFDIQTNTASKGLALTTAGGVVFVSSTGSVSITGGTTTPIAPTAKLHLAAGTAAVNTAPLKFTSGPLLTNGEAGAMEYLTDAYYVTTTTNTIRRMVVAGSTGRATAQNAANASVATYTLGATDASYKVSMNVLITTSTLFSFTCECAYTDEGNTARVVTLNFTTLAGVISNAALTNAGGAVPYEGVPLHIRCKASTAITLRTQAAGTYTTVTFNAEGFISQIA